MPDWRFWVGLVQLVASLLLLYQSYRARHDRPAGWTTRLVIGVVFVIVGTIQIWLGFQAVP